MKSILSIVLFALAVHAMAQVPGTLSYQGILTDASGNPVADGAQTLLFNFYTGATGGSPIEARGPLTLTSSKGLFMTVIGNGQGTNNAALPFSLGAQPVYVGIVANGGSELTPRVQLTAVAYAFRAAVATALDAAAAVAGSQVGAGINATNITSGTLPAAQIGANSIDNTKLASGIDASKITTGTLPASVIPSSSGVPVGTIIAYAGTSIPSGWLLCDGTAISRTSNSPLFTAIGVTWGGGDGTTTFNLPDFRGTFLRGVDYSAGNDPDKSARTAKFTLGATGNNVGSYQLDLLKAHTHTYRYVPTQCCGTGIASAGTYVGTPDDTKPTGSFGGGETRPINAYVNYIIKAQ